MMFVFSWYLLFLVILPFSLGDKQDETSEIRRALDKIDQKLDNSINELKQMMFDNNIDTASRALETFVAESDVAGEDDLVNSRTRRDSSRFHVGNVFVSMYENTAATALKLEKLINDTLPAMNDELRTIKETQAYCGKAKSCLEHLKNGHMKSGVYKIFTAAFAKPIEVYCDQETDGGGWTVFQRRQDGSVDFYRGWSDYETGFGNLDGEFWLGNENIHRLTAGHDNILLVELEDFEKNRKYAKYTNFMIGTKSSNYVLIVDKYTGDAGDSLSISNGQQFSTKNKDNDRYSGSCAQSNKGAWWYKACHHSNLNGQYIKGGVSTSSACWYNFKNKYNSLKFIEMKFRENRFD